MSGILATTTLADVLAGLSLRGAPCRGRAPAFDGPSRMQGGAGTAPGADAARRLCFGCVHRATCAELRHADGELPGGVWGGRFYLPGGTEPIHTTRCVGCGDPLMVRQMMAGQEVCHDCAHGPRRRGDAQIRQCAWCAASFRPEHPSRRYCGAACSQQARDERKSSRRRLARGDRSCRTCDRILANRRERYCSDECRLEADRLRSREARLRARRRALDVQEMREAV